jgi:hypothetical protein
VKLPFGERADLGTNFEDYTLNTEHRDGKHKARVFESALGITQDNADLLRDALNDAAVTADNVLAKGDNGFGEVYILDFPLLWSNKLQLFEACGLFGTARTFHA